MPAPAGGKKPSVVVPPGSFKPAPEEVASDAWIFSGALQDSHEAFSGTLVASSGNLDVELKLAGGATCDGSGLSGETGLLQMSEISCTDERSMRVLFVPEKGRDLKVFGQVGSERFLADAHLLGTEPPPEPKRDTAPSMRQGEPDEPSPSPGGGAAGQDRPR